MSLQVRGTRDSLELALVLFQSHPHQLAARPHSRFVEQALQDGFDVAFLNLQMPGDLLI